MAHNTFREVIVYITYISMNHRIISCTYLKQLFKFQRPYHLLSETVFIASIPYVSVHNTVRNNDTEMNCGQTST